MQWVWPRQPNRAFASPCLWKKYPYGKKNERGRWSFDFVTEQPKKLLQLELLQAPSSSFGTGLLSVMNNLQPFAKFWRDPSERLPCPGQSPFRFRTNIKEGVAWSKDDYQKWVSATNFLIPCRMPRKGEADVELDYK